VGFTDPTFNFSFLNLEANCFYYNKILYKQPTLQTNNSYKLLNTFKQISNSTSISASNNCGSQRRYMSD